MKLQAGTVVATVACPDCGSVAKVKVNKNGNLYLRCMAIIDAENRERCYCVKTWGRASSKKMIAELTNQKTELEKVEKNDENIPSEAATVTGVNGDDAGCKQPLADNAGPATAEPAKRTGGIFGAWL